MRAKKKKAPAKRRTGRRSLLTPKRQGAIVEALRHGSTKEFAAAKGGVGRATFFAWLARGEEEEKGPHRDLLDAVTRAQEEAIDGYLASIAAAGHEVNAKTGQRAWQAHAWLLERMHRSRFGPSVKTEHSGHIASSGLDTRKLTTEQLEQLDALLSAATPDET